MAHALLVREKEKSLQRFPVGLKAIGPKILAEKSFHSVAIRPQPGNRRVRSGDILEPFYRAPFGLVERLVQVHRQPRMTRKHIGFYSQHVHDGENPGFPKSLP